MSTSSADIASSELEYGNVVGRGTFGVVRKAMYRGEAVAVKHFSQSDQERESFHNEMEALRKVSHENIVKLIGYGDGSDGLMIVMEFAECGNLYDLLHNDLSIEYSLSHALSWCYQSAKALSYLHRQTPALVHRDFKPPNLLLMDSCRLVKVCDFGIACDVHTHMTSNRGTTYWMAPEVFKSEPYTEQCDTFSFAITVWEIMARKKPFNGKDFPTQYAVLWAVAMGTRPPLLTGCPEVLEMLLARCWHQDASLRPAMSAVESIFERLVKIVTEDQPLTPIVIPDKTMNESGESVSLAAKNLDDSNTRIQLQTETEPANNGRQFEQSAVYDIFRARINPSSRYSFYPFHQTSVTSPGSSQVNNSEQRVTVRPPSPPVASFIPSLSHIKSGHRRTGSFDYSPPLTEDRDQEYCVARNLEGYVPGSLSKSKSLNDNSILGSSPDSRDELGASAPAYQSSCFPRQSSAVIPSHLNSRRPSNRVNESPEDDGYRTLTEDAYLGQVDPKLRPLRPDPANEESVKMFEEHKKKCKNYTELKTESVLLDETLNELQGKLRSARERGYIEFSLDDEITQAEIDLKDLVVFRSNLKTQLSKIMARKQREDAIKDDFVWVETEDRRQD